MSLLDEYMEPCVMMDRRTAKDQYGGFTEDWVPGAEFSAAIVLNESLIAQIAAAKEAKGEYVVTVKKPMRLQFHDVFKRVSDDQIFRVTSKDEKATPNSASLNMRSVKAEEWELTSNG